MEHIYTEHYKRKTTSLNGDWEFAIDPDNVGKDEKWYEKFPKDHYCLNIPGCWNLQILDLFDYKGIGWYKKDFYCEECILQLEFGAVSGECEVYLDGEFLCNHFGGWTAFSGERRVKSGKHTLILRVLPVSEETCSIPLKTADWYHYGGIFRSVEISEFCGAYISSHKISYTLNDDLTSAQINIDLTVSNCDDTVPAEILIDGKSVFSGEVQNFGGKITLPPIPLEGIKLWDIGEGNLYEVRICIPEDDIIEKVGFREIKVRNSRFYLNRKEIFFKGVNRHEEHADWGFALPANISRRDVEIIKDLGCNIVRGSHYPQSHTFIDYLDREGILFWSEIPMWGWNYTDEVLTDPKLIERGLNMHKEMAEQYCHHPSIVVWGLHNEIHTDAEEAYSLTKAYRDLLKSIAPDRLISYATDKFFDDKCLDLVDFISLNYYFGWYKGTLDSWDEFVADVKVSAKEKGVGDKPIIMSEFGCASLQGYSHFSGEKWTMQYQCEFIKKVIDLCIKTDGFCGTLVWQFADIKSEHGLAKARQFNNKGILDEYRRPKMAYYTVKELYEKIK